MVISGHFFFALFGMSQLLVAGYLPQMWKNVTSNNYFETPCGFKGSILPEVIYKQNLVQLTRLLMTNQNQLEKQARSLSYAMN